MLKTETDRQALLSAIKSGSPKFFMGSDSAPHLRGRKESSCCAAGCFTAHALMELYTMAFEEAGCLENLASFCSEKGAQFYGLPPNEGSIVIKRETWHIPETLPLGEGEMVPMKAGEDLPWKAYLEDHGTVGRNGPEASAELAAKRPKLDE